MLTPLLWTSIGLRKGFGTVAYYEWQALEALTRDFRQMLEDLVATDTNEDMSVEGWLGREERTVADVHDLLLRAAREKPNLHAPAVTLRPSLAAKNPAISRARIPGVLGGALETLRQRDDRPALGAVLQEAAADTDLSHLTSREWLARFDALISLADIHDRWSQDGLVGLLFDFWRLEHPVIDVFPNQAYRFGRFLTLIAEQIGVGVEELQDDELDAFLRNFRKLLPDNRVFSPQEEAPGSPAQG